jgi:ATP-dependent Clp protease protease subunit
MIHQPSGGAQGQASDISISAKEILRWREILNEVLATQSGQPIDKIEKDTDRDYYMTAYEAKEYGLIDEVVERKSESDGKSNEEKTD